MQKTKKLLYSLYAAGAVLGTSMLSGCVRTVYVSPDGYPSYGPTYTPACNSNSSNTSSAWEAISGVLMGIGQGLSSVRF